MSYVTVTSTTTADQHAMMDAAEAVYGQAQQALESLQYDRAESLATIARDLLDGYRGDGRAYAPEIVDAVITLRTSIHYLITDARSGYLI